MSPNGRRAWRRFAKQQRRKVNRRHRQSGTPWINDADGAFYRHEQRFFSMRPTIPIKPYTARSLVGMTMGARKRKRWGTVQSAGQYDAPGAARYIGGPYRIGQRLRPCPGCCACWGADVSPADFGYDAECFGPRVAGRTKREISRMRQWQRTLVDDCDGSGVLTARKLK